MNYLDMQKRILKNLLQKRGPNIKITLTREMSPK